MAAILTYDPAASEVCMFLLCLWFFQLQSKKQILTLILYVRNNMYPHHVTGIGKNIG